MKPFYILPLVTLMAFSYASAQDSAKHEQVAVLKAADLLPAESLRGPSYRVRDQVVTDGYMAYFQIDSDFGMFEAAGVPQAKRRMVEIEAIRTLVETSKGDTPKSSDGVVEYWSSHLDSAKSEKIVPGPHGSCELPETIDELRRILHLHLSHN